MSESMLAVLERTADERERLQRRVRVLEAEVAQLTADLDAARRMVRSSHV